MGNTQDMSRVTLGRCVSRVAEPLRQQRMSSTAIWVGGLMITVGFLLHPRILDFRAADAAIQAINTNVTMWRSIHWLTAAGFLLWTPGMLSLPSRLRYGGSSLANAAIGLLTVALGLWLFVLIFEAVVLVDWAQAWFQGGESVQAELFRLIRPFWSFGLLLGYTAAFCIWLAIGLWGYELRRTQAPDAFSLTVKRTPALPPWFGVWGMILGATAAMAVPVEVLTPSWATALLLITGGPAFLWTWALGYFFWVSKEEPWP